jgi:hypothetical protein
MGNGNQLNAGGAEQPGDAKKKKDAKEKKPFWASLPGILTQVAALITAIAGLLVALDQIGVFDPDETPTPTATLTLSASPTDTPTSTPTYKTPTLTFTQTRTPTITRTATITRTPTPTYTATFYPSEPILVVLAWPGLNVRRGPGYNYPYGPAVALIPYGSTARILGKDPLWEWFLIECPIGLHLENGCWITSEEAYVNTFFADDVQVVQPPPTFTPRPSATPTPPG